MNVQTLLASRIVLPSGLKKKKCMLDFIKLSNTQLKFKTLLEKKHKSTERNQLSTGTKMFNFRYCYFQVFTRHF